MCFSIISVFIKPFSSKTILPICIASMALLWLKVKLSSVPITSSFTNFIVLPVVSLMPSSWVIPDLNSGPFVS